MVDVLTTTREPVSSFFALYIIIVEFTGREFRPKASGDIKTVGPPETFTPQSRREGKVSVVLDWTPHRPHAWRRVKPSPSRHASPRFVNFDALLCNKSRRLI